MPPTHIYSGPRRVRKAYWTAAVVMFSYFWLNLRSKFLGQAYYARRITALHLRNAERVKTVILQLNGLFIKIGQLLSILSNFLPEEFQKPLAELQDKIPPRPFDQVRERIERELGQSPETLFARFDETPLAAASIGQAHRAQLHDGTEVVVKVQHADIEEIARIDLEIMRRLTAFISFFFHIKGMGFLYTQVRKMIEEELDFASEARYMTQIAANLPASERVFVPEVHPAFSTTRVLTTTFHEGVKISELGQLDAWKIDRRDLAVRLLRVYCKMLLQDGLYHADPHPGNILVQKDGTIVLLDFGATGELSPAMREGIPQLIEAAVKKDTSGMVDAFRTMGFLAEGREASLMAEQMISAMQHFLQNEVQLDGLNFKDIKIKPFDNSLFRLIQDIGLGGISGTVQVPKDWVLLNRMLTLLLGLCNTLDPKLNPLDVVRPYAKDFVLGQRGDFVTLIRKYLQGSIVNALSLPDELRQVLQKARQGKIETLNPDVRDSARLLYLVIQQVLFAILGVVAGAYGWWLRQQGDHRSATYAFIAAGLCAFLMLLGIQKGERLWRRMRQ
ncbi:MAG: AarF/ABC1/UbiB kinase family protein [Saprospiraceae bacterium]|nr:AarF/ABC1/UbiB kinase family protein [Saprospiraceae bacterium]